MRDQWLDTARNIFALLYAEAEESSELPGPRVVMRSANEESAVASYDRPAATFPVERSA